VKEKGISTDQKDTGWFALQEHRPGLLDGKIPSDFAGS